MPSQTTIFRIEVDPNLIPDGEVAPLLAALSDFAPVLEDFGRQMQQGQQENFVSQGAAFGDVWAPLRPATVRDRFRKGYGPNQMLVRTGNLADHIGEAVLLTPSSVQVGVDTGAVPYAPYLNKTRLLVAVTSEMVDQMLQALRAYLAAATGGEMTGITIVAETA